MNRRVHAEEEKPYLTRQEADEIQLHAKKDCTFPRTNTYFNNQYGVLRELNAPTLASDLEVLREISGYAGTLNQNASDILVDEVNPEVSNINEFMLSPNAHKARDPFLGRPTDTRIKEMNTIQDTCVYMNSMDPDAYVMPKPTFDQIKSLISKEVWQPIVIGRDVGKDSICACQLGNTTPVWALRAVQMSNFNHQKLFLKLKQANVISHVEKLIVYPPNGDLCMCSWIGTDLAGRFATFTERLWERRARQEINLERRIDDENEEFVKQVVAKIEHVISQRTANTYGQIMKKRAWERRDPVDSRLAPNVVDMNVKLDNSNFVTYFGPESLSNPDMASFVRGLTNPWGKGLGLNERAKIELGLDFSRHADPRTVNETYA